MSIPSTSTLRTFVEVARSQSFTRAAETLCLSQSAVSKQIQSLEEQVGARVFVRGDKTLRLTASGRAYLSFASEALAMLDQGRAAAQMAAGEKEPAASVEIAASPAFAAQWLVPRLQGFRAIAPHTRLVLRPRLPDSAPQSERFDLEIRVGAGRWADARAAYLMGREMALVASPGLVGRGTLAWKDLQAFPLLQRAQRGYDWAEWGATMAPGWRTPESTSLLFEGFSVLVPAVTAGLGLAVCPLFLVIDQLEAGTLVRPLGECVHSRDAFHAVLPAGSGDHTTRDRLLGWLHSEAQQTNLRIQQHLAAPHSA